MSRSKKIKEKKPEKVGKIIHDKKPVNDELIHFSFKYLELGYPDFSVDEKCSKYFKKMLDRLKHISQFRVKELLTNRSPALRCHPIDWVETSQPNGFEGLNEQLQDEPPYQFEVSANEHGRVHGFFIKNNFYVVWFDPDHKLYVGKK